MRIVVSFIMSKKEFWYGKKSKRFSVINGSDGIHIWNKYVLHDNMDGMLKYALIYQIKYKSNPKRYPSYTHYFPMHRWNEIWQYKIFSIIIIFI